VSPDRFKAKARILLVEDDPIIATLVSRMLASLGDVRLATSGEEAAELAPGTAWDLVVTDVELGGMTGIELIQLVTTASSTRWPRCAPAPTTT
jgi:CheY-like chemotaxis protein